MSSIRFRPHGRALWTNRSLRPGSSEGSLGIFEGTLVSNEDVRAEINALSEGGADVEIEFTASDGSVGHMTLDSGDTFGSNGEMQACQATRDATMDALDVSGGSYCTPEEADELLDAVLGEDPDDPKCRVGSAADGSARGDFQDYLDYVKTIRESGGSSPIPREDVYKKCEEISLTTPRSFRETVQDAIDRGLIDSATGEEWIANASKGFATGGIFPNLREMAEYTFGRRGSATDLAKRQVVDVELQEMNGGPHRRIIVDKDVDSIQLNGDVPDFPISDPGPHFNCRSVIAPKPSVQITGKIRAEFTDPEILRKLKEVSAKGFRQQYLVHWADEEDDPS